MNSQRKGLIAMVLIPVVLGLIIFPHNASAVKGKTNEKLLMKSFDIVNFGLDKSKNPYMNVKYKAGVVQPTEEGIIYAYVFHTDKGIFALTSHMGDDSDEVDDDTQYHAHKVTLDNNGCISSLHEDGDAYLKGRTVKVLGTGASQVSQVATVKLMVQNSHHGPHITHDHPDDDHDNGGNDDGKICMVKVFDKMTKAKKSK